MKTFILLIFSVLAFQCHSQRDQKFTNSSSCDSTELFRKLLESAINNRSLQKYYHYGVSTERSLIFIISTNKIDTSSKVKMTDPQAKVITPHEMASRRPNNYLEIETLEIINTTGMVNLYYPMEGIYFTSKFHLKDNCTWVLIESTLTEH